MILTLFKSKTSRSTSSLGGGGSWEEETGGKIWVGFAPGKGCLSTSQLGHAAFCVTEDCVGLKGLDDAGGLEGPGLSYCLKALGVLGLMYPPYPKLELGVV